MPRLYSILLLSLLIASSASAVTMDWTPIGNPGNSADTAGSCFAGNCGSVAYAYNIGTYDVAVAQYAEFLNAKARSDSLGLYNRDMSNVGGVTQSGSSGNYTYTVLAGRENWPVEYVSWYTALRFANWMNNGQGNGDTETGAYTLLGGTPTLSNGDTVTRNAGATIVLTSENEWYKAAYYVPSSSSYFAFPTSSNIAPTCSTPTATSNSANCNYALGGAGHPTAVGSYTGSPSPYGTFDQGGNVYEWNEAFDGLFRGMRGGDYATPASNLAANGEYWHYPPDETGGLGFRLAMIPEPSTGLLVIAGLLGLAGWRRRA